MKTNRRMLRGRNARGPRPANPGERPGLEPRNSRWLADAEELLVSLLSLVARGAGSLTLGIGALYGRAPAARLQSLEKRHAVLPWASLLVGASALFSALYPLAFDTGSPTLRDWSDSIAGTAHISSYVERFIPVLGIGLIVCGLAHLRHRSGRRGHKDAVDRTRLLASTFFALSLASGFLLALGLNASLYPSELAWAVLNGLGWPGWWFLKTLPLLGLVVPISVSFALARWGMRVAPAFGHRGLRFVSQVLIGVLSLPLGIGLTFSLPYACYAAISTASPWFAGFKESAEPAETAEFHPHAASCVRVPRGLSCTFSARTSGSGDVLLDMRYPLLVSSQSKLGSGPGERKRLSLQNSTPANPVNWGLFTHVAMHGIEWSFPKLGGLKHSEMSRLELGKTFVADVLFTQEKGCQDEPPESMRKLLQDGYSNIYLVVTPAREDTGRDVEMASTIGPWRIPAPESHGRCP